MAVERTILIATTNPGKVREVRSALRDLPVRLVDLTGDMRLPTPEETGESFEDNAVLKAGHYATLIAGWALADDSGLEVDALRGRPGVQSARFAGPECDDSANNARLVALLRDVDPSRRQARFRCVLALAEPGRILAVTHGVVEGLIIDVPRGHNGFGYDPHFFIPNLGCTAAELSLERKNRISHRGSALEAMSRRIESLLHPASRREPG